MDSEQTNMEDKDVNSISGDQNVVSGKVENGGVVIQGREHEIRIVQNFNTYATLGPSKSPNTEKIIKDLERFEPETILIPEGPFFWGSDPGDGSPGSEKQGHQVFLPNYRIGKYPVKNVEYQEFVSQSRIKVDSAVNWNGQAFPEGFDNYPVTGVTFKEALTYCRWLSAKTEGKRIYTLPSEVQWEKACRGGNNYIYPWGNKFDEARCNHGKSKIASVDAYKEQNDFGCYDLVGNIQQWTCTLWGKKLSPPDPKYAYPWQDDAHNNLEASDDIRRVIRGSRRDQDLVSHRCCGARSGAAPGERGPAVARFGFRVVMLV